MVMFGSPYTSLDVHTPLGMYSNVYTVKAATLLPVKNVMYDILYSAKLINYYVH